MKKEQFFETLKIRVEQDAEDYAQDDKHCPLNRIRSIQRKEKPRHSFFVCHSIDLLHRIVRVPISNT